jgi:hypothetical protein
MSAPTNPQTPDPDSDWVRDTVERAVADTSALGIIPDELIEARAIWSVPGEVMIGQMRQPRNSSFYWFISGNLPTDHIDGVLASTAREALRSFSLKWQMDAERYADPATRQAHDLDETRDWDGMVAKLVAKAEELYAMAEDDRFWQRPDRA